jgi:hypothetical protein
LTWNFNFTEGVQVSRSERAQAHLAKATEGHEPWLEILSLQKMRQAAAFAKRNFGRNVRSVSICSAVPPLLH